MFFPYSDDNPTEKTPWVTYMLIGFNTLLYAFCVSLGFDGYEVFVKDFGYYASKPTVATALTSMFLHGGIIHLLENMWALWLFGDNVEDRLGHYFYLLFYLLSGFAAIILHSILLPASVADKPLVGASGAISGVLAAYMILHPWAKVNFVYWFYLVFYGVIQIPALYVILFWILTQFVFAAATHSQGAPIAFWAHVGGFAWGAVAIGLLRVVGFLGKQEEEEIGSSPSFRRMVREQQISGSLPSRPDTLQERFIESTRFTTTTVSQQRSERELQLLLRAIHQNEEAKVVKFYSLFEQAFPRLALPEPDQWKAATMLYRAGQDTLALEASRKVIDQYPGCLYWVDASLLAGKLFYKRKNYQKAQKFLRTVVGQAYATRLGPADPQTRAEAAKGILRQIEKDLQDTEIQQTQNSEQPQGSYLILRQTFEPIHAADIGDMIAGVTGELKLDARGRVARGQGLLAEGLRFDQAQMLAQMIRASGVPVMVVSEQQLLVFPPPVVVNRVKISETEGLFQTYDKEISLPLSALWLFNCTILKTTEKREQVVAPLHMHQGQSVNLPITREVTERKECRILDLFILEPFHQLRIMEDKLYLESLPDQEAGLARQGNFTNLVKEIARFAPSANAGPGIDMLMSEESFKDLTFDSIRELERYNFWLVQLYHLKPKT